MSYPHYSDLDRDVQHLNEWATNKSENAKFAH